MFFLCLPKNENKGRCRINGQDAEFRIIRGNIEWRHLGDEDWNVRGIMFKTTKGKLTEYTCNNGPGSKGPYTIITPELI
jgi:hypothetical protein